MSVERIRELLDLMRQHELGELELRDKDFSVRLVKGARPAAAAAAAHAPAPAPAPAPAGAPFRPAPARAEPAFGRQPEPAPEGLREITSPIVGTFYRAASPDADPFVDLGARVEPDTTICIIEAMKVMNEVKAEASGVIRKVLVENGQPVEFGQPIFLIEPAESGG
jgi:acetyl-CoA carboxylase biotin carboxyl carrier protein